MQLKNDMTVWQLIYHGHRGDLLRAQLQEKTAEAPRMVPHFQERIDLMSKAKGHGALFTVTGGTNFTSNDMFLSMEKPIHDAKVRELET